MRKFPKILLIVFLITSCGPSAKEHESKRIADSSRVADSFAMVNRSINDLNLSTKTTAEKKFIKTAETRFEVTDVRKASDKIEDLTAKYSGYLTFSQLQNRESFESRTNLSRDSVLITRQIIIENHIELRIPNENLDTLIRKLNKLILFLDYRTVKLDEVTFNILANQKATERLKEYDIRQKQHIATKAGKLKETTNAEENILNKQTEADKLAVENLQMADQVKYCNLIIFIYQKPINYKEVQVRENTDSFRQNLFSRILDALVGGWIIFEDILVFLFQIWWLILFLTGGVIILRFLVKKISK